MDSVDLHRRKAGDVRVILHIDLDCFYCQVEHRRLGIPRDIPLAVQQWDGLIAVNYPARARGISRHMRAKEAKSKCNDLVLVHVETIGVDHLSTEDSNKVDNHTLENDRLNKKACLERYRLANAEILDVLHAEIPTCPIEKASIDEVYIDVTTLVDTELERKRVHSADVVHGTDGGGLFSWGSILYGDEVLDPLCPYDARLASGAMIASRLRGAIQTQCQFTSSAGISCNKLLAKIGSAKNKPNQQTLIRPRMVDSLMSELPLRKLRNFGGKLGEDIESLCNNYTQGAVPLVVRDVLKIPLVKLQSKFGPERALWILDLVHGMDGNAEVVQKERTKSMLAAKSFAATSDLQVISRWFDILASELESRMKSDLEMYNRRPKTLGVSFRSKSCSQDRTRQSPMPKMPHGNPCKQALSNAAFEIFKSRCAAEAFPCVRLALSASDFQDCPDEKSSIARFFSVQSEKAAEVPAKTDASTMKYSTVQCGTVQSDELKHDHVPSDLDMAQNDGSILSDVDIEQQRMLLKEASMLHRLNNRTKDVFPAEKSTGPIKKRKQPSSGKTISQYFSSK